MTRINTGIKPVHFIPPNIDYSTRAGQLTYIDYRITLIEDPNGDLTKLPTRERARVVAGDRDGLLKELLEDRAGIERSSEW